MQLQNILPIALSRTWLTLPATNITSQTNCKNRLPGNVTPHNLTCQKRSYTECKVIESKIQKWAGKILCAVEVTWSCKSSEHIAQETKKTSKLVNYHSQLSFIIR